jgi:hypothetical protein
MAGCPLKLSFPGVENGAVSRARSKWLWHVFMVQARDDAICALTAKGPADSPTMARTALGSNNLAGGRLAGVNLGLRGVALACRCGLLADERFLLQSHRGVSSVYLTPATSHGRATKWPNSARLSKTFKSLKNKGTRSARVLYAPGRRLRHSEPVG